MTRTTQTMDTHTALARHMVYFLLKQITIRVNDKNYTNNGYTDHISKTHGICFANLGSH